jgi:hypothetical protein
MHPSIPPLSRLVLASLLSIASLAFASVPGWQPEVAETLYPSTADQSQQPTLFYWPKSETPVPLLVALHTWSNDYRQPEPAYAEWCIKKNWAFIHPNFRGPNNRPEACGSELAVADILSAVEWAKTSTKIDTDRIYLIGVSGGGYGSMLLAGRAPTIWAGISAWAGIFDLADWFRERQPDRYANAIANACGGTPGTDPNIDGQYRIRSASHWLQKAANVPVDIQTGIHDGHRGSVPISHSLKAFNALASPADQLTPDFIADITRTPQIPESLRHSPADPLYPKHPVLFRRTSGNTRITLFEGGHEIVHHAGLAWLEKQRKGKPAVWDLGPIQPLDLNSGKTESGK